MPLAPRTAAAVMAAEVVARAARCTSLCMVVSLSQGPVVVGRPGPETPFHTLHGTAPRPHHAVRTALPAGNTPPCGEPSRERRTPRSWTCWRSLGRAPPPRARPSGGTHRRARAAPARTSDRACGTKRGRRATRVARELLHFVSKRGLRTGAAHVGAASPKQAEFLVPRTKIPCRGRGLTALCGWHESATRFPYYVWFQFHTAYVSVGRHGIDLRSAPLPVPLHAEEQS